MSNKIHDLTEVPAYPALSLVADVGGVLGLFIGFNFLMLWDWVKWCYVQIRHSLLDVSPLKNT